MFPFSKIECTARARKQHGLPPPWETSGQYLRPLSRFRVSRRISTLPHRAVNTRAMAQEALGATRHQQLPRQRQLASARASSAFRAVAIHGGPSSWLGARWRYVPLNNLGASGLGGMSVPGRHEDRDHSLL